MENMQQGTEKLALHPLMQLIQRQLVLMGSSGFGTKTSYL
jgi:hypothetical protein